MEQREVVVAQIGCGYWGPNLLRNFSSLVGCSVKYVVELDPQRRTYVTDNYPSTIVVDSLETPLMDDQVDAIIVATPAGAHFALTKEALEAGKHVLVEKPLATSLAEVDELGQRASQHDRVLMVGHTFIFNEAVRYVRNLIASGELGDVRYIYSQRLNLGRIRSDIDALWNLAPHDLSIVQYWLNDLEPIAVARHGMDYIQSGIEDVVFLTLEYPNKIIVNIHVSWLDPKKVRTMTVVGTKKMAIYDDLASEKVAIYDKGIDPKAILGEGMDFDEPSPLSFSYRSGDVLLPRVDFKEPLRAEAEHFLDCIRHSKAPVTGVGHARTVVSILERARRGGANQNLP